MAMGYSSHHGNMGPSRAWMMGGYTSRPAQEYGVALRGLARPDYRWQAREGIGFALADFHLG